jgi:hypothetical protein
MQLGSQFRSRLSRTAEVAVERARLTVVPRGRTRASRMPFVALVTIILLGGVVGLLLFNTSMQQSSFAATALESQANTLAARQQSLQMELDRLRDPQRIAAAAQRLGMVQTCSPAFLTLGSGKVSGKPCAADGANRLQIWERPKKPAILTPPNHVVYVPGNEGADTGGQSRANGAADGKKKHQNHQSQQSQR